MLLLKVLTSGVSLGALGGGLGFGLGVLEGLEGLLTGGLGLVVLAWKLALELAFENPWEKG